MGNNEERKVQKNKETASLAICKSCKIMEVESLAKDTING